MDKDLNSTKKFWLMLAAVFVAIFLGCFLAFYVLAHQMNKNYRYDFFNNDFNHIRMHDYMQKYMEQADRMFEDFDKEFADINDFKSMPTGMMQFASPKLINGKPTVQTLETPKDYIIKVNLKAFNNDPKNVQVKTKDKRIIISADYSSEKDDSYNSSVFYQSFNLPIKIDASMIKKEVKNNYLTVTIPKNVSGK